MSDYGNYVQYKLLADLQAALEAVGTASSSMKEDMEVFDNLIVNDVNSAPYAVSDVVGHLEYIKDLMEELRDIDAQLTKEWTSRLFT